MAAGAGPAPIPFAKLNADNLGDAIRFCLAEEASLSAAKISEQMKTESGVHRAVANFHANLPLGTMRCDVMPDRPAAWSFKRKGKKIRLSKDAAGLLVKAGRIRWKDVKRYARSILPPFPPSNLIRVEFRVHG